jgi:hypothetical protein
MQCFSYSLVLSSRRIVSCRHVLTICLILCYFQVFSVLDPVTAKPFALQLQLEHAHLAKLPNHRQQAPPRVTSIRSRSHNDICTNLWKESTFGALI